MNSSTEDALALYQDSDMSLITHLERKSLIAVCTRRARRPWSDYKRLSQLYRVGLLSARSISFYPPYFGHRIALWQSVSGGYISQSDSIHIHHAKIHQYKKQKFSVLDINSPSSLYQKMAVKYSCGLYDRLSRCECRKRS